MIASLRPSFICKYQTAVAGNTARKRSLAEFQAANGQPSPAIPIHGRQTPLKEAPIGLKNGIPAGGLDRLVPDGF